MYQILCSNTLRRKNLKVYGSLKENKLTYFTNSKGSFQGLNLVRGIRKKSYTYDSTRCKFLYLGGARMYQEVSANKAYKKIVCQNFQFFQPLKITFMCTCDFCRYEHYNGISEHFWKKIMQLLLIVVTYSLKKC